MVVLAARVWLQGCRILLAGYWVLHANARPCCEGKSGLGPGRVWPASSGARVRSKGTTLCCTHDHVMPHRGAAAAPRQSTNVSPKVVVAHLAGSAWASLATALFPLRGSQSTTKSRWAGKGKGSRLSHFVSLAWSLVILPGIGFTTHQVNINFCSSEY